MSERRQSGASADIHERRVKSPRTVPNDRRQRGLELAATVRILYVRGRWLVPSQTHSDRVYVVRLDATDGPSCACPDQMRGVRCKHIYAAEFVRQREAAPAPQDGAGL